MHVIGLGQRRDLGYPGDQATMPDPRRCQYRSGTIFIACHYRIHPESFQSLLCTVCRVPPAGGALCSKALELPPGGCPTALRLAAILEPHASPPPAPSRQPFGPLRETLDQVDAKIQSGSRNPIIYHTLGFSQISNPCHRAFPGPLDEPGMQCILDPNAASGENPACTPTGTHKARLQPGRLTSNRL